MNLFITTLLSAVIQLAAFVLIPLLWWILTERKENFFSWIGLKKPKLQGKFLNILIVITAGMYIAAMYLIMNHMLGDTMTAASQFSGKGVIAIPAILVYAIIQTSLSEELFFRGFLLKRLTHKFGFAIGNLLQSLLFGLMHGIPFGLATGDWIVCILLTLLPGTIGYVQGWMNERRAGGSIIPSWILHALMNIMSAL